MDLYKEFLRLRSSLYFRFAPYSWLDDKFKIEYLFYKKMGYRLDLKHPQTFNEKLQWMKLYYRNTLCTQLSDKYAVREYIAKEIGEGYLNALLAVYEHPTQVDWNSLPNKYVLKLTHGCHWNILCTDKTKLDITDAQSKIHKWFNRNLYNGAREWQYKNIKPKIIVEIYLDDGNGIRPVDYKFYCFNGKAESIQMTEDEEAGITYYFDRDWNLTRNNRAGSKAPEDFYRQKPGKLAEMLELADQLAQPFPFVRVDFYYVDGNVIFGEFTFTPTAGYNRDRLPGVDKMWGEMLTLESMREGK